MARTVITIVILVTTLVLVIFGARNYLEQRNKLYLELEEELEAVSSQVASSMALPLWNVDSQQIDEIIKSIMQNPRVLRVTICEQSLITCNHWIRDKEWNIVASTGPVSDQGFPKKERKISFANVTLGKAEVVLTTRFVRRELNRHLFRTALNIFLLNILLVALFTMVLQKMVLRPLKKLERYAVRVRKGEAWAGELHRERFRGELASLVSSFESMTKKLEHRIELETLIADISRRFIDVSPRETNGAVDWALKIIGNFLGVDRCYMYLRADDEPSLFMTNEWSRPGIEARIHHLRDRPITESTWPVHEMAAGEIIRISGVDDLAPQTLEKLAVWRQDRVESIICMPMGQGTAFRGFMGLEAITEIRSWSEEDIQLIRMVGEIISNTLERQKAEKELAAMNIHLEELVEERTRELGQKAQDLVEAMKQAQKANESKNEFLAGMSHEIRTPMNAIIGLTNLVLKSRLDVSQKDYLQKVIDASRHLLSIINDILDFSKIEAGRLELENRDFQLSRIINHIADMFGDKSAGKQIELYYMIDPGTPGTMKGDPLRIGQVLINLISNAVKFTDRGEIVVRVHSTGEPDPSGRVELHFSVSDAGIGIPSDKIDSLFEPFTQVDGSVTRKYGGTGLGLSICRRLVELMDGRIWVESEIGSGSTFHFTVNLGMADDAQDDYSLTLPRDLHGLKTLVIDDNSAGRVILKEILESFEFEVATAASAREGLERLKRDEAKRSFDLVVLDWMMPEMDGFELAQRIRNDSRISGKKRPKTIMVTMYGRDDIIREKSEEESGIDGFLIKPISSSELFNTVMTIYGHDTEMVNRDPGKPDGYDRQELKAIRGARILLAEDNALNQDVAVAMLERVGILVECADNGKIAVDMLDERSKGSGPMYDVVLMDIQMPEMDGYHASREIRADARFQNLPIIAMTAHALKGDRDKCLDAGMNDYVSKPVEERDLYAALLKWIEPGEREIHESDLRLKKTMEASWEGMPSNIPGIDQDAALARIRGNTGLYKKMLWHFKQNFERAVEEIGTCIAEGKTREAEKLTHAIKGTSGNIGANDLYRAAKDLDEVLKQENRDSVDGFLDVFSQNLTLVLHSLEGLNLDAAPAAGLVMNVKEENLGKIVTILKEMRGYLEKNSARARHGLKPLKEMLGDTRLHEQVSLLDKAVYLMDSEKALAMILEIENHLRLSSERETR